MSMPAIPIDQAKWHRVDPWPGVKLPEGHRLEVTVQGEAVIARVVGPHAHVFGKGPDFDAAILGALDWLSQVGGEL